MEGKTYELSKYEIIILPPKTVHSYLIYSGLVETIEKALMQSDPVTATSLIFLSTLEILSHTVIEKMVVKPKNWLRDALQYTKDHYLEKTDLKKIASLCEMTPATFCRHFKKLTGMSWVDTVLQFRIEHACRLLEEGGKVQDSAFASGFENVSWFILVFKRYKGVTPAGYKSGYEGSVGGK